MEQSLLGIVKKKCWREQVSKKTKQYLFNQLNVRTRSTSLKVHSYLWFRAFHQISYFGSKNYYNKPAEMNVCRKIII